MDSVNIKLSIGGTIVLPVHPVFGDDVKLKISQAENQIFYRTKIDGKIIFSGADFDLIDSCNTRLSSPFLCSVATPSLEKANSLSPIVR